MYKEELYEEGIVKEANGGFAIISIQDSDDCNECTAKVYCKTGNSEGRSLTARDPYGVRSGDRVRVAINGNKILRASFQLYGIPLILLLAGVFLGLQIFNDNTELYSSILAFGSAGVYALIMFLRPSKNKAASFPEIISVSRLNNS